VSRRLFLGVGTVTGAGALAVASLALVGSAETTAHSDAWSGWTGRIDTVSVADRAAMTPDDPIAVVLLSRSAAAASSVAYAGVAVSWDRAGTVSTELSHLPGTGTVARPVGTPSSQAMLAPEGRSGSFADDGRPLSLLRDNYRVLREADLDTTIAGRTADAVVAVDAAGVLQARYWIDRATGLLLRKELLDTQGAIRQRTGFSTLRIGPVSTAIVPTSARDAWTEPLNASALATARTAGCACPEALPGGLELLDSRRAPAGSVSTMPVVHQLFSDGLVSVSLFSFTGAMSPEDGAGLMARGFSREELAGSYAWVRGGTDTSPTATVVWTCRGSVLTLVTDDAVDPLSTAAAVLAAFPSDPDPADDTFWTRVGRGWTRVTGRAA
jgi:sigma-E factor negative regulatory protein RseB